MGNEQLMEALGILQEECAEVIVVISKIRRFGLDTEYIRGEGTKRSALIQELGDVQALVKILINQELFDSKDIELAAQSKIEKLKKYSNLENLDNLV